MFSNSPASQAETTAALRALFTAFPTDRAEGPGFAATYHMAAQGYSLRAIEGAVKRIVRGEADDIDKRFLPTPAQLGNLVAHMERLFSAPEPRLALPAPGDVRDNSPEGVARREAFVAKVRERFGIRSHKGETVIDREAIPEAKRAALDREVKAVAERIASEGLPKLSDEARALFREQSDRSVPDPGEQYDDWRKASAPLPTPDRGEAA